MLRYLLFISCFYFPFGVFGQTDSTIELTGEQLKLKILGTWEFRTQQNVKTGKTTDLANTNSKSLLIIENRKATQIKYTYKPAKGNLEKNTIEVENFAQVIQAITKQTAVKLISISESEIVYTFYSKADKGDIKVTLAKTN